jgi:hypothetical protein
VALFYFIVDEKGVRFEGCSTKIGLYFEFALFLFEGK